MNYDLSFPNNVIANSQLNQATVNNDTTDHQNNSVKDEIIYCKFIDPNNDFKFTYHRHSLNERQITVEPYHKVKELDQDKIDYLNKQKFRIVKRPQYASYQARLDSFKQCTIPYSLGIKTELLALSGLFYTGYGDRVKCFSCGVGLRYFVKGDNEFLEHAHWAPQCEYIKEAMYQLYLGQDNKSPCSLLDSCKKTIIDRIVGKEINIVSPDMIKTKFESGEMRNFFNDKIKKLNKEDYLYQTKKEEIEKSLNSQKMKETLNSQIIQENFNSLPLPKMVINYLYDETPRVCVKSFDKSSSRE